MFKDEIEWKYLHRYFPVKYVTMLWHCELPDKYHHQQLSTLRVCSGEPLSTLWVIWWEISSTRWGASFFDFCKNSVFTSQIYLDVPRINALINEYICSILEEVSFKLIWMILLPPRQLTVTGLPSDSPIPFHLHSTKKKPMPRSEKYASSSRMIEIQTKCLGVSIADIPGAVDPWHHETKPGSNN